MQRITANENVEDVLADLGVGPQEKLRESEKRRRSLEKFSQLRSRNPNVTLDLKNTATAFVEIEEGEIDEFRNITVTTRKIPQKKTDLPEKYHDYLIQKGMTVHEVGHVLYSSYPAIEKYMEKVKDDNDEADPEQFALMFKHFVNVLEDGAIEKFLAEDFRVDEELLIMRASLHEDEYMGKEYAVGNKTEYHYPFFFAVMTACLNIGVYDNGELRKLVDEDNEQHVFGQRGMEFERDMFVDKCIPEIKDYIPKIQSETDAEERTRLCYELWKFLQEYIDRAATPGKTEFEREMKNQEGDSYSENVPANISEAHGDQEGEPVFGGSQEDAEGGEEESGGLGEERKEEIEEEAKGQDSEAEEKAERGIIDEAKQGGDNDWSDEVEQIINALSAGDGVDEIAIANDGDVLNTRKRKAERHGKRMERLFRRRLRQLQKDKTVKGKRRGRIDDRKLIGAERGNPRIFEKTKEGDQKNYSCLIITDRSGSMSGRIDEVELAIGSVAYGLEGNGVDTSILDTYDSMTTLAKPFSTSVENFTEKIFANRVGGGTPLRHTVNFARQRVSRGEGDVPFAIIITDGRPARVGQFKEEVKKANFPVLGLYLTNSKKSVEDQLSLYDKAVTVTPDEDVSKKLTTLINQIMF